MGRPPVRTVLVGPDALLREGIGRILDAANFPILVSTFDVDDSVLSAIPQEQSTLLVIDVSGDFDVALAQVALFRERCPSGRVAILAHDHQLPDMVSAFRAGANAYLVRVATCDAFIKSLELVMLGVTLVPPQILALVPQDRDGNQPDACSGGLDGHAQRNCDDQSDNADDSGIEDDDDGGGRDDNDIEDGGGLIASDARSSSAGTRGYTPKLSARQTAIVRCLIEGDSNKKIARKLGIAEATVKVHVKAILRKIRVHNRTQAAIWAMNNGPFIAMKGEAPAASAKPSPLELPSVLPIDQTNGSAILRC